jgi:hypothetical protein
MLSCRSEEVCYISFAGCHFMLWNPSTFTRTECHTESFPSNCEEACTHAGETLVGFTIGKNPLG